MRYIMLIYAPDEAAPDPEMLAKHGAFTEQIGRRGKLVDASELADVATATTVRRRGTDSMVTDGPHAETKEHLGGYYVVDCADLDEALELASAIPLLDGGAVEVRPLVDR